MIINLTCPKCFTTVAMLPLKGIDSDAIKVLQRIAGLHACPDELAELDPAKPQISPSEIAALSR